MTERGTNAYKQLSPVPPPVARAVRAARAAGFADSCRPEQGRLLHVLAGGATGTIAETGTGCGVGLAWPAAGAGPPRTAGHRTAPRPRPGHRGGHPPRRG
ncbi:hypothetical protein [Streptomyces carpaticus]|uniref:Uncharacterized protein n=1 Tax=Streptomyces carpaticus TaxID=285558 RepID=A0ABV4ZH60_9ACTN